MTRLEWIINEAKLLPPADRHCLLEALKELAAGTWENDADVGRRGLSYLTDSTRHEGWSAYYPESLRTRIRTT